MKPLDRRQAVLRQLGRETDPITLTDLAEKLHFPFAARTMRRLF